MHTYTRTIHSHPFYIPMPSVTAGIKWNRKSEGNEKENSMHYNRQTPLVYFWQESILCDFHACKII